MTKPNNEEEGFYRAEVEISTAPRALLNFMTGTDPGLAGLTTHRRIYTLDFKPGEEVDTTRVDRILKTFIAHTDAEDSTIKCNGYYRILSIVLVKE